MHQESHPFENLRVLVVEDDPDLQREARAFFENLKLPFGFSTRFASSAAEAILSVPGSDVVLCDTLFAGGAKEAALPQAVEVANCCFRCGVPVALLTSHPDWPHKPAVHTLSDWTALHGIGLFGHSTFASPMDHNVVAVSLTKEKPWKEAFCGALYLKLGVSRQAFAVAPDRGFVHFLLPPASGAQEDQKPYARWPKEWREARAWKLEIVRWASDFCNGNPRYSVLPESLIKHDALSRELDGLLAGIRA